MRPRVAAKIGCLSRRRSPKVISAMDILLSPIGWVHSNENAPREDYWGEVVSEIVLDRDTFSPEALDGLSEFSHVEVLFHLHGVDESSVLTGRRHPRGNAQ